jgi:hypothetical protein
MATGKNIRINNSTPILSQIIADHTVVADYDKIPAYYMAEVKKMWLNVPGESHSYTYRYGLELLEALDGDYAVNAIESGGPEAYTDDYLRSSRTIWTGSAYVDGATGETVWFTWYATPGHAGEYKDYLKAHIQKCHDDGYEISALGFGWCWDMSAVDESDSADPVYGCHWYGMSAGGPDGDKAWGLDDDDYGVTSNRVNIDTYLGAMEDYIAYCTANSIPTKMFFTTGPVDTYTGEVGYQVHLKHERIRAHVLDDSSRILFDYADILCYDNDGTPNTTTWSGHTYPIITTTNLGDAGIGHIGEVGAVRIAKALWWMLARMAGWDGN